MAILKYEPITTAPVVIPSLKMTAKPLENASQPSCIELKQCTEIVYEEALSRLTSIAAISKHPDGKADIYVMFSNREDQCIRIQQWIDRVTQEYKQMRSKADCARDIFQINSVHRELYLNAVSLHSTITEVLQGTIDILLREQEMTREGIAVASVHHPPISLNASQASAASRRRSASRSPSRSPRRHYTDDKRQEHPQRAKSKSPDPGNDSLAHHNHHSSEFLTVSGKRQSTNVASNNLSNNKDNNNVKDKDSNSKDKEVGSPRSFSSLPSEKLLGSPTSRPLASSAPYLLGNAKDFVVVQVSSDSQGESTDKNISVPALTENNNQLLVASSGRRLSQSAGDIGPVTVQEIITPPAIITVSQDESKATTVPATADNNKLEVPSTEQEQPKQQRKELEEDFKRESSPVCPDEDGERIELAEIKSPKLHKQREEEEETKTTNKNDKKDNKGDDNKTDANKSEGKSDNKTDSNKTDSNKTDNKSENNNDSSNNNAENNSSAITNSSNTTKPRRPSCSPRSRSTLSPYTESPLDSPSLVPHAYHAHQHVHQHVHQPGNTSPLLPSSASALEGNEYPSNGTTTPSSPYVIERDESQRSHSTRSVRSEGIRSVNVPSMTMKSPGNGKNAFTKRTEAELVQRYNTPSILTILVSATINMKNYLKTQNKVPVVKVATATHRLPANANNNNNNDNNNNSNATTTTNSSNAHSPSPSSPHSSDIIYPITISPPPSPIDHRATDEYAPANLLHDGLTISTRSLHNVEGNSNENLTVVIDDNDENKSKTNNDNDVAKPTTIALTEEEKQKLQNPEAISNEDVHFLLPYGQHDIVVPIYGSEVSSMIAHALVSKQYISIVRSDDFQENDENKSKRPTEKKNNEYWTKIPLAFKSTSDWESKMNFTCDVHYAAQFEQMRKMCGIDELDYVKSLTRSLSFHGKGGASGSMFSKTRDEVYILKHIKKIELDGFLEFAPQYFGYFSQAYYRQLTTALAKVFGVYTVCYKNQQPCYVVVMENLFCGRTIVKKFDLKGSLRSRHAAGEVLLDENLLELMYEHPILVDQAGKALLGITVWNDSLFLSSLNVMDYSLIVGIDSSGKLIVGIIDYLRRYTWDKQLESWVKKTLLPARGGGTAHVSKVPTIISPKQYQKRFSYALWLYFNMVPNKQTPLSQLPERTKWEEQNVSKATT